jgi:threonine dehydrogenase-like Zn-dependent dehydrogenase
MIPCGHCGQCTRNAQTLCVNRSMLGVDRDGAFAEFVLVPAKAVHRVPEAMPFDVAAYSEPVAAALAVFNAGIRPGERGLVYGRNRFSQLVCRLLRSRAFDNVEAYDPPGCGRRASSGGTTVRSADPTVIAPGHLESNAYDFAIETVATTSAFSEMIRATRPRGTLVLKSRTPAPVGIDIGAAVAKELTFRTVFYGSFREAIGLLAERAIVLDDLLGPIFRLDQFEQVFARARDDESSKLFFSPGGEHVRGR